MTTVLKGACLFNVLSNNSVNDSMLPGLSFARLKDNSVRNLVYFILPNIYYTILLHTILPKMVYLLAF